MSPGSVPWALGLLYGMHVYTTFRWPISLYWFNAHCARLASNAQGLGLEWPYQNAQVWDWLGQLFNPVEPVMRLSVVADVDDLGSLLQNPGKPLPVRLLLTTRPLPSSGRDGLRLQTAIYRRPLSHVKQGAIAESLLLRRQAKLSGLDDVLFTDASQDSLLRETSTANLFLVLNGALLSPDPVNSACLPGITRLQVLEDAPRLGIPLCPQTVAFCSTLEGAEGAFVTNAASGVMPIREIRSESRSFQFDLKKTRDLVQSLQSAWLEVRE